MMKTYSLILCALLLTATNAGAAVSTIKNSDVKGVPACPAGSVKSVTIRGGGQNPKTVDLQMQETFTVANDGCIVDWAASSVTCTPGTTLLVNVKAGLGPMPTSCTWNDVPVPMNTPYVIECPAAAGDLGMLICDNKDAGGKDVDRITVTVQ